MENLIIERNDRKVFMIHILLNAGSYFETEKEHGLSHLLEHMMFKSKKSMNVETLLMKLNQLGGIFNAATSKDYTGFFIRTFEQNWKQAIDLIYLIVFEPRFDTLELEKEKKVVIEEFLHYEDSIKDKLVELSYDQFLPSTNPYQKSVKGTIDIIKNCSVDDLKQFYRKYYQKCMIYINCPNNIQTLVSNQIKVLFSKYLKSYVENKNLWNSPIAFSSKTPAIKILNDTKRSQNATCLMFRGFPFEDEKNIVLNFIWDVLLGSLNSLLMMEIREKKGLVYSMTSYNDCYKLIGLTGIYFTSSHENIVHIVSYILNILQTLKIDGLTNNVLTYSKESYLNKLKYRLTNIDYEADRSIMRHYYKCKWDEDFIIKLIVNINNEKIKRICQEVFNFKNISIISIGKYIQSKKLQEDLNNLCFTFESNSTST
jgi:predicted Zn-dependent peptidase